MQLYVSHLLQVVISVEALKTGKKGNTYQVIKSDYWFFPFLYMFVYRAIYFSLCPWFLHKNGSTSISFTEVIFFYFNT